MSAAYSEPALRAPPLQPARLSRPHRRRAGAGRGRRLPALRSAGGLSLLVFAALIGGTVLAIHPTALNDRMLLPKLALLVAGLAPLAENVSMLSVCIALVCLSAFALPSPAGSGLAVSTRLFGRGAATRRRHVAGLPGDRAVPADPRFLPLAPHRQAARQAPRAFRGDRRVDHAAVPRSRVPGAVRRGQPGHRILAVADRPSRAARHDPGIPHHLLDLRAGDGVGVPAAAPARISCAASRACGSAAGRPAGTRALAAGPPPRTSRRCCSARRRSCAR